ncbi:MULTISPECIES: hypothetical protein [Amycolatopsis]|uniref:Secreted protein n=1 Tax=Amycolatopsis albidoflavus TaxID=102226 RepID=A0ABW5IG26_9PSEU
MRIGKKLAATAAAIGMAALGGMAAAPAHAAPMDVGIHLNTSHNAGVYNTAYVFPVEANKVAPNLHTRPNPATTDGIDADCYTSRGYAANGHDKRWYHATHLYYNDPDDHPGSIEMYAWVYAPYVDNSTTANEHLIPDCQY